MIEFIMSILISWCVAFQPVFWIMTIYALKGKDPTFLFGHEVSQQSLKDVGVNQ